MIAQDLYTHPRRAHVRVAQVDVLQTGTPAREKKRSRK